jgi:hypothetical protein
MPAEQRRYVQIYGEGCMAGREQIDPIIDILASPPSMASNS